MNLFNWFKKEVQQPISFKMEIPDWEDSNSKELFQFLKTSTGTLFLQHLQKHNWEVNQWATDVSMENYENMKYRSCVAHGVKLSVDKIYSMSRVRPENKHTLPTPEKMDQFFSKRMGMFKS